MPPHRRVPIADRIISQRPGIPQHGCSTSGWMQRHPRCERTTMASADSCRSIPARRRVGLSWQTDRSPGVRHVTFAARPPHLRRRVPDDIGLRVSMPSRPRDTVSYAIPVPQAAALPAASFRPNLATATLAVRLTVPVIKVRRGLSPLGHRPCPAHMKRGDPAKGRPVACLCCV